MITLDTLGNPQTLAYRMAQGRLPVADALRNGMILADALRKLHDAGQAHGGVTPASIVITRGGLELLPALGSVGEITPNTAPEVVEGKPADSRSDIFSFGTILYEMLTGRPAFTGEGPALAAALMSASPAPSGSPAVDRLVAGCTARDPSARWQRMQKLLLELKLLAVAVQRAESKTPHREVVDPMPAMRAELQQVESRLAARLLKFEVAIDSVNARISGMEEAAKDSAAGLVSLDQALHERIAQLERTSAESIARAEKAASERITLLEQADARGADRMERVEHAMENIRRDAAALRDSVAEDLAVFDKTLKSQNTAIESARTAMSQTDDLVERVVEALESLQSAVLEHAEERVAAAN